MRTLNKIIAVCFIIALTVTMTITPILADNVSGNNRTDIDPYMNGAVIEGTYYASSDTNWNGKPYIISMNTGNKDIIGTGITSFNDAFRVTNLDNGTYKNIAFTHTYTIQDGTGKPLNHIYWIGTDTSCEALFTNDFSITIYNIDFRQNDFVENYDLYRRIAPVMAFVFKNNVNPQFTVRMDTTYEYIDLTNDEQTTLRTKTTYGDNTTSASTYNTTFFASEPILNCRTAEGEIALDIVRIVEQKLTVQWHSTPNWEEFRILSQAEESPNIEFIKATSAEYQNNIPKGTGPIADFTAWIGQATSGFLNTEIYPGLKFWYVLMIPISLGLLMGFLRLFSGG